MAADPELLRKWVETWRRAGPELERIHRHELQAVDTREAVRQIFGTNLRLTEPAPTTSGLVEQQAWFMRLHGAQRKP
jgi:hypothetical protein